MKLNLKLWLKLGSQAIAKTSSPFFHSYCLLLWALHIALIPQIHTVPRLCYKNCRNIRLLNLYPGTSNWRLSRSIDHVQPQRRKMSLRSCGTRAAAAAGGSMCCRVPLASPAERPRLVLRQKSHQINQLHFHLSAAPSEKKWSFCSIHQLLFLFFAFSRSQDAARNVSGFCVFSSSLRQSEMYLRFPGWTKWNESTFSRSPKVLSTGMQEQTQLSKIAGRAALELHACSDPNLDKRPVKGLLFFQQGTDTSKNSGYCALNELIYY